MNELADGESLELEQRIVTSSAGTARRVALAMMLAVAITLTFVATIVGLVSRLG